MTDNWIYRSLVASGLVLALSACGAEQNTEMPEESHSHQLAEVPIKANYQLSEREEVKIRGLFDQKRGPDDPYPLGEGEPREGYTQIKGGVQKIFYVRHDGTNYFEGDIALPDEHIFESREAAEERFGLGKESGKERQKSATRRSSGRFWTNNIVYYTLNNDLTDNQEDLITDAIDYYHQFTSLTFIERVNADNWVDFRMRSGGGNSGVSSSVGMAGGMQTISITAGADVELVLHEIGHAVGLYHEQSRSDRDDFVNVLWANIRSGSEGNFRTYVELGRDGADVGPYDFNSAMHYGSGQFARSPGLTTLQRVDGQPIVRQRANLSTGDRYGLRYMYGLGSKSNWHASFASSSRLPLVGDFNGDGADDIVSFSQDSNGYVRVALSDGNRFVNKSTWASAFCRTNRVCRVGDFNGDGRDDILAFVRNAVSGSGAGDVFVALSTGNGFGTIRRWHGSFCHGSEYCEVGDFNGDGRDDIVAFTKGTGGHVWVSLSQSNNTFGQGTIWKSGFCLGSQVCKIGDINGDGRDDVYAFVRNSSSGSAAGDVLVARSLGGSNANTFGTGAVRHSNFCTGSQLCRIGDVNGDGRDDIIAFQRQTGSSSDHGNVYFSLSKKFSYGSSRLAHENFCLVGKCLVGNFNGQNDELDDFINFTHGSFAAGTADAIVIH